MGAGMNARVGDMLRYESFIRDQEWVLVFIACSSEARGRDYSPMGDVNDARFDKIYVLCDNNAHDDSNWTGKFISGLQFSREPLTIVASSGASNEN